MRLFEITEEFTRVGETLKQLEVDYTNKIKGKRYIKAKTQLLRKLGDLKQSYLNYGTGQMICVVTGKIYKANLKNVRLFEESDFTLYLVNVTESEVEKLIRMKVPNYINYRATFINSGVILTSS